MNKPRRIKERSTNCQEHLWQFREKHITPAQERVKANPETLGREAHLLFNAAKPYFKSLGCGRPGNKEALCLYALERLDDLVNDEVITEKALGNWERRGSQVFLARLILYPLNPWPSYTWSLSSDGQKTVQVPVIQPGFVDYARSFAKYSYYATRQTGPSPPPPGDPAELDLEAKVLKAEQELERHRAELQSYRESKKKAAQEQLERERLAKQKAEQEARARADREAREKSERKRRAREQASRQGSSPPQWALVLELTPPYTEDQIRTAYRKMSKLTHPDLGGIVKKFR